MTKLRTLSYDDNLRELAWGLERDADYFAMYDAQQRSEARAEGLVEGRQEGRQEASRTMLVRLVSARFGALPETARNAIALADMARLEQLADALLTATSLEDLFLAR
jgi:predicted transposase YdaD